MDSQITKSNIVKEHKIDNMPFKRSKQASWVSSRRVLVTLVFILIAVRLLSLGLYPLMDTTEARYGEIGRKMIVTGDWITPWFSSTEPFWGKPPLSFWMTALSFKLFGLSELSARLPHFICGLGIGAYLYQWLNQAPWHNNRYSSRLNSLSAVSNPSSSHQSTVALYTVVLLSGALLYFLSSGIVMTDMWMLMAMVLVFRGYWDAMQYYRDQNNARAKNHQVNHSDAQTTAPVKKLFLNHPYQAWLVFVGLGIGLIAKGPIAVVLCGLAILPWMLISKNFVTTFKQLPIILGLILTCLIALPWYILAELKTPGFLNYFIMGEHVQRFLVSGWAGDKYGTAHEFPRGTIWIFLLVDWLPWAILLPIYFLFIRFKKPRLEGGAEGAAQSLAKLTYQPISKSISSSMINIAPNTNTFTHTDNLVNHSKTDDDLSQFKVYLWCWALATLVFFTFSGNIIWPYTLPAFPAIAILLALWLSQLPRASVNKMLSIGLIFSIMLLSAATAYMVTTGKGYDKSAKGALLAYQVDKSANKRLYYYGHIPFSAEFYSQGAVQSIGNLSEINSSVQNTQHIDSSQKAATYVLTTSKNAQTLGANIELSNQNSLSNSQNAKLVLVNTVGAYSLYQLQ